MFEETSVCCVRDTLFEVYACCDLAFLSKELAGKKAAKMGQKRRKMARFAGITRPAPETHRTIENEPLHRITASWTQIGTDERRVAGEVCTGKVRAGLADEQPKWMELSPISPIPTSVTVPQDPEPGWPELQTV